eukprot:jgi/Chrzof1/8036/UNPLg00081.t1
MQTKQSNMPRTGGTVELKTREDIKSLAERRGLERQRFLMDQQKQRLEKQQSDLFADHRCTETKQTNMPRTGGTVELQTREDIKILVERRGLERQRFLMDRQKQRLEKQAKGAGSATKSVSVP